MTEINRRVVLTRKVPGHRGAAATGDTICGRFPLGTTGTFALTVTPEHLASRFKDAILPPVFATPMMILAMENAALNAIRAFLDPGESAVGSAISVRHLAATPVGQRVTATAEVTKVAGRKIEFAVRARDETEEIGEGTHERTVIDVQRLLHHLESKSRAG